MQESKGEEGMGEKEKIAYELGVKRGREEEQKESLSHGIVYTKTMYDERFNQGLLRGAEIAKETVGCLCGEHGEFDTCQMHRIAEAIRKEAE